MIKANQGGWERGNQLVWRGNRIGMAPTVNAHTPPHITQSMHHSPAKVPGMLGDRPFLASVPGTASPHLLPPLLLDPFAFLVSGTHCSHSSVSCRYATSWLLPWHFHGLTDGPSCHPAKRCTLTSPARDALLKGD
eukprot:1160230-Pelagomonas_calceolata.AAC.2